MKKTLLLLSLYITTCLSAQTPQLMEDNNFMFVDIKLHSGVHMYTGEDLAEALSHGYGSVELRLGWQMDGSEAWHHNYGFPAFGVGYYTGFIGDPDILGKPNALYGFISFPISPNRRHTWISELSFGLTYDLQNYDPIDNPYNDAIGARGAVYFNYNIGGRFNLNREMDLLYGVDFTHFSNGRSFQPNYGLNMFGVNVGARYHFNSDQKNADESPDNPSILLPVRPDVSKKKDIEMPLKEHNFLVYQAVGTTQNGSDAGTSNRYFNSSTVLEYQYFINLKHAATVGLDMFYDGSLTAFDEDPWMYGYHVGYDYRVWRFSIRLQVGGYLKAPDRKAGFFFRPAAKFDISKHLYTQIGLKTLNGGAADWVEFGMGVKL